MPHNVEIPTEIAQQALQMEKKGDADRKDEELSLWDFAGQVIQILNGMTSS